jgi:hypothetical protein
MDWRVQNPNVPPETFRWSERGPLLVKRVKNVVFEKWYVLDSIIGHLLAGAGLRFDLTD